MLCNSTYTDVLAYLSLAGDDAAFHKAVHEKGHRMGQAFFNALNSEDQEKLRGSLYDPFYKDSHMALNAALDFLLSI